MLIPPLSHLLHHFECPGFLRMERRERLHVYHVIGATVALLQIVELAEQCSERNLRLTHAQVLSNTASAVARD